MVVILLLLSVISGVVAAFSFWIAGYGIGAIALAYWTTGTIVIVLIIFAKILSGKFVRQKTSDRQKRTRLLRRTNST